jgi:hypothetical protein
VEAKAETLCYYTSRLLLFTEGEGNIVTAVVVGIITCLYWQAYMLFKEQGAMFMVAL